ncbi:MAG: hypothetical protein R3D02_12210 [Hyphomicrobiales bacterium]
MRLFAGVLALSFIALPAAAGQSPYDTTFAVDSGWGGKDIEMRAEPEAGSKVIGTLPKDAKGIILRWCRPEFNFRNWAYGSREGRKGQLKDKACEISFDGKVGFVDGDKLVPED